MLEMEESSTITLLIITTIGAGVLAQVVANYIKVPSIVFLLILGVGLGRSGFQIIEPRLLDMGLEVIVTLSVALILFEGGLKLQLQNLGKVSASIRNLTTIGVLISLVGGGIAAHYLSEFPWPIAFLYASLVVVTGPTVINPILKEVNLDRRLSTILEGEGVLIDAVGAALAVVVLDMVLNKNHTVFEIAQSLILRLGTGVLVGMIGGTVLCQVLRRSLFLADEVKSSVVLAGMLGFFAIAQNLQSESGLMAAVLMGIVLRAESLPDERLLLKFNGQLTVLIISIVFILLSANLSIPSLLALGWGGVTTVLILMLVVRPINILVSTWNSSLTVKQKLFLAWCAPRGIVAASVSSLFASILTQQGVNGGESIKALVFLTIAMTVFLQGLTAKSMAKFLGLSAHATSGLVIVGANPIGLLIAKLFQNQGQTVAIIDTNPESCKLAIAQDIPAFASNGLDMRTMAEAGLDYAGTFMALTINPDINLVVAQRVIEEFRPPKVMAVYVKEENTPSEIQQAFGNRVPIKAWNQYLSQKEVRLGEVMLTKAIDIQLAQFNSLFMAGNLLPILLERKQQMQVISADMSWEEGDRIIYLLYTPKLLAPSFEQFQLMPPSNQTIDIIPEPEVKLNSNNSSNNSNNDQNDQQVFLNMAREILKKPR